MHPVRRLAKRLITGTHTDPRMGLTNDFPTAAAKWEKKQRQRKKWIILMVQIFGCIDTPLTFRTRF